MRVKTAGGPRRPGATSLPERVGVAPRRRKVQFDDQRPGWDFTTSDIGKFKLTPEQVEVRVRRVHGASRSRAASLTPRVLPLLARVPTQPFLSRLAPPRRARPTGAAPTTETTPPPRAGQEAALPVQEPRQGTRRPRRSERRAHLRRRRSPRHPPRARQACRDFEGADERGFHIFYDRPLGGAAAPSRRRPRRRADGADLGSSHASRRRPRRALRRAGPRDGVKRRQEADIKEVFKTVRHNPRAASSLRSKGEETPPGERGARGRLATVCARARPRMACPRCARRGTTPKARARSSLIPNQTPLSERRPPCLSRRMASSSGCKSSASGQRQRPLREDPRRRYGVQRRRRRTTLLRRPRSSSAGLRGTGGRIRSINFANEEYADPQRRETLAEGGVCARGFATYARTSARANGRPTSRRARSLRRRRRWRGSTRRGGGARRQADGATGTELGAHTAARRR